MHILFLTDNFPPESNAPATRTFEHALRWVVAGHQVTVVTCCPNFPNGEPFAGYKNRCYQVESIKGIRVVRVKTYMTANEGFLKRTLDYMSFMLTGTIAALFQRRCDVIVATSPQFFCGIAGMITSTLKRKPFVLEIRDLWPESIVAVGAMGDRLSIRLLAKLELLMYRRATKIVVVTNAFKKAIAERLGSAQNISVVTNGVDASLFKPQDKNKILLAEHQLQGKFVVGYIGTHGLAHDLINVLKAVEQLKHHSNIAFIFAGPGAERSNVEATVAEKDLSNAHMLPSKPREQIPELLAACDVTLIPLRDTPLFSKVIPSKLFESMAMGVPVVMALPPGEATAIVEKTGCGVVVAPGQPEALARAITLLSEEKLTLSRLSSNAVRAAPSYSRDFLAKQMLGVIAEASTCSHTAQRTSGNSRKSPVD